MSGYVTIGTNDLEAALKFYDALFSSVGVNRLWKHEQVTAWGRSKAEPAVCIASPFDGEPASVGNGAMIALRMTDRKAVDRLHAKSFQLGGLNEGRPGPRGVHGLYGGCFRDLNGNKLNAYVPA